MFTWHCFTHPIVIYTDNLLHGLCLTVGEFDRNKNQAESACSTYNKSIDAVGIRGRWMANIIVRVAGVSSATLATETEGAGLPASLRRTNGPASSQSMESTGSRGSTAFAKAVMNFATPLPMKAAFTTRLEERALLETLPGGV
jgi:hypothetical protein